MEKETWTELVNGTMKKFFGKEAMTKEAAEIVASHSAGGNGRGGGDVATGLGDNDEGDKGIRRRYPLTNRRGK